MTKKNAADGNSIEKLGGMIRGIKIAMMTTFDEAGFLRSRPMVTQQQNFDGVLWFFTRVDSAKAGELGKDQRVNLSYANVDDQLYVSVSGKAQVFQDKSKAKELWNPMYKAWFPDGLEDPNLALLKVEVDHAEYWDSHSSAMVHLIGFTKAVLTGKQYHPGENEKVNIAAGRAS